MPKSSKTSSPKVKNNPSQDEASIHDKSSSDQEIDHEVIVDQSHVQQAVSSMFITYIEGPKMGWAVNNGLYHRFLKWRLECENILEYELAMLAERKNARKLLPGVGTL